MRGGIGNSLAVTRGAASSSDNGSPSRRAGGREFRYLRARHGAFCVEAGRPSLRALLSTETDAMRLDQPSRAPVLKWLTGTPLKYARSMKIVLMAAGARVLAPVMSGRFLELPVCGDFAVPRRPSGYKVFDLQNRKVGTTGVYNKDDFEQHLSLLDRLGQLGLAPELLDYSKTGAWYVERFLLNGRAQPLWRDARLLETVYLPFIRRLQAAMPQKVVEWREYRDAMERLVSKSRMAEDGRAAACFAEFRDKIEKSLNYRDEIVLYASHGDLNDKNLLATGGNSIAVDWETFGYRSKEYDLCSCLFSAFVRRARVTGAPDYRLFGRLRKHLLQESSQVCEHGNGTILNVKDSFRIFVLEFIALRISRFRSEAEANPGAETRKSIPQLHEYMDAFHLYEHEVGSER